MRRCAGWALLAGLGASTFLASCSGGDSGNGSGGPSTGGSGGSASGGTNATSTSTTGGSGGTAAGETSDGGTATDGTGGTSGSSAGGNGGTAGIGGATAGGNGGTAGTGGGSGGTGTGGGSTGGTGGVGGSTGTGAVGGSAAGGSVGEAGDNAGGEAGETSEPAPEPRLTDLSIEGTRVPLAPAFDADTERYVAYPTLPAGELSVTAVATEGLSITIAGTNAESGVALPLPEVTPDNTFDVIVTNAEGATQTYTVVYVPTSYPELLVKVREPEAAPGPIYLTPRSGSSRYVIKFNDDGVPLYYARQPRPAYDFKKHPNGLMSYAAGQEGIGHSQIILNSDYEQVDEVTTVGLGNTDQHDFSILPSGNFIVVGLVPTERDLTPFGGPAQFTVLDGVLQEITPERNVVFEWNTWDYVSYDENLTTSEDDYAHINSVFVDTDGNWIVSMRSTSQIVKIDRETGEVLWRFGGISNEFVINGDPFGGTCGQHAASRLASGNLLIFDNGNYCDPDLPSRSNPTRAVEYSIDEESLEAELVWSYSREGLVADSQGSVQRLPNGNTLIGWGNMANRSEVMLTEVTPAGEVVFEVEARLADDSIPTSYRAWRFAD